LFVLFVVIAFCVVSSHKRAIVLLFFCPFLYPAGFPLSPFFHAGFKLSSFAIIGALSVLLFFFID